MEVFRRVLVLGRIAAADVSAGHTEPQMHPCIACFQAIFASMPMRFDIMNFRKMITIFHV
jgi:hypothetical protein